MEAVERVGYDVPGGGIVGVLTRMWLKTDVASLPAPCNPGRRRGAEHDHRDQRTECIISTVTDPTQLYTFRINNDTTIRSSLTLRLPVQAQILPEINAEYRLQY